MLLLKILTRNPYDLVKQRIRMLYEVKKLRPHNNNLCRLEYEDYYKAVEVDANNTLYIITVSLQTNKEIAIKSILI